MTKISDSSSASFKDLLIQKLSMLDSATLIVDCTKQLSQALKRITSSTLINFLWFLAQKLLDSMRMLRSLPIKKTQDLYLLMFSLYNQELRRAEASLEKKSLERFLRVSRIKLHIGSIWTL
jgi:hypothetical protein